MRIRTLTRLRTIVNIPKEFDISERSWWMLQSQLTASAEKLLSSVKSATRQYLPHVSRRIAKQRLNARLGEVEMEMTKAYTFFDTYMDVLTQRNSKSLGGLLSGCDVLAADALKKNHVALQEIESPIVYCDRGFGASILREGVLLPDMSKNPLPLIQIPYSRLKEKYNLTSLLHEAGHEALVRLGIKQLLPKMFDDALTKAGATQEISEMFQVWASEIGPDFWAFCASGIAQPASIREIMALPIRQVLRVSITDPHPPPYLRVLLSFEWSRQVWGEGMWNTWEKEWKELYPLEAAGESTRRILQEGNVYLPVLSRVLLRTKFKILNNKTLPDLFELSKLHPVRLREAMKQCLQHKKPLRELSPSAQLAVFRLLREENNIKEEELNSMMSKWLINLSMNKQTIN
ncbi:MAG: hypothetical protein HY960_06485 [Ignavibacteriae bacterium]|nr:hypothetical protein [Ignavibacteriota bacterium]